MARSATPPRSSPARRAKPPTPVGDGAMSAAKKVARATKPAAAATGGATKGAKKVASAAKKSVGGNSGPHLPTPNRLARTMAKKVAKKAAKAAVRKSAEVSAAVVRRAADRAASMGRNAYEVGTTNFVPILLSIDVAVPIHVAWEEWRSWGSLPEGVHRIEDVERDGDVLVGHTAGTRGVGWEAEIQDEREDESFAWRSLAGTDVAGLATFHHLDDRLTRIELNLDVVPTNPAQALTMALRLAHRHAEADLRRFKAHVEFISPDDYEEQGDEKANGRSNGRQENPSARKRGKRSVTKA